MILGPGIQRSQSYLTHIGTKILCWYRKGVRLHCENMSKVENGQMGNTCLHEHMINM